MSAATLPVANSYAALAPDNPLRRRPRAPRRPRPEAFTAAFDARTLFYDCFRHRDGERILLVGPPPYGIPFKAASFVARPSGTKLSARFYPSLTTMITELSGAPPDTGSIAVTIAGETHILAVQPNVCADLAGRKLLFSINRDNDLAWIREWAEFHARIHGTDAVILVDNGSSRYAPAEILATLHSVPGIAHAAVPSWPYSFGPIDPAVRKDPYWARFLQIGSMSAILRRYGELCYGLLDCDIDELAGTHSGRSIYDLAYDSKGGLVVFRGIWIEATGQGTRHRDFAHKLADPGAALSPQRKWALDPSRRWVQRLSVHPYWHWIEGRAMFSKSMPDDATYWHFKAINTNWKAQRTATPTGPVVEDMQLSATMSRFRSADNL
jgi:hypothetical protein